MEWQSYIDGCGCGRANASTEEEEKNEKTNTTVKISPSSPLTLRRGDSTYDLLLCHMHRQRRSVTGSAPQAGPDKVRTRMG